jgi:hypothetical protein
MLLRRWKPLPKLSSRMAKLVLSYTHLAVVMHVYFTRAMYASWPFDSACAVANVTAVNATAFEYCDKDTFQITTWMKRQRWQSDVQFLTVEMFNYLLPAILAGLVASGSLVSHETILGLFFAKGKPTNEGSSVLYSEVNGVESYIPVINQEALLYPGIAADCHSLSPHLLPTTVMFAQSILAATGHPVPLLYEYMEQEMERKGISMECVLPELGTLTVAVERADDPGSATPTDAPAPVASMRLKVTIVCGKGLLAMDVSGTSDPFCRIFCGFQSMGTTTTKMKTLEPEWGEDIIVNFGTDREKPLRVTVFDYDYISASGSGEFLGKLEIPSLELVEMFESNTRQERDYKLLPHFSTEKLNRFFSVVKGYGPCACLSEQRLLESAKMRRQPEIYRLAAGGAGQDQLDNTRDMLAGAVGVMLHSESPHLTDKLHRDHEQHQEQVLRKIFAELATTDGSDGKIGIKELTAALGNSESAGGRKYSEKQLVGMIGSADVDGNGHIDVDDFILYCRKHGVWQSPPGQNADGSPSSTSQFTRRLTSRANTGTAYAHAISDAATSGQLVYETSGFTYMDTTGALPEDVCLEVSMTGLTISTTSADPGLHRTCHASGWVSTDCQLEESEDPQEMSLIHVTYVCVVVLCHGRFVACVSFLY